MVKINNKICGSLIDFMVREANKDLDCSNAQIAWEDYVKHVNMLLEAYNTMRNEEYQGTMCVYDVNNKQHMLDLLQNDAVTMYDIHTAISDGHSYLQLIWDDTNTTFTLHSFDETTLENILKTEMKNIMTIVLLYTPYNDSYMEVYRNYVSTRLEVR